METPSQQVSTSASADTKLDHLGLSRYYPTMTTISMVGEGLPSYGGSLPPATGEGIFGAPAYPGQAPILDDLSSAPDMPREHHALAPPGAAPETVSYEGGGIFQAQTPGPSDLSGSHREEERPQGQDFGPSAAPMPPMMMMPPMAAPGMPDIGPPPMHGGVLGQEPAPKHNLGLTLIVAALGVAGGWRYGGPYGGLAGGLFGGAAVNAFRAFKAVQVGLPDSDKEAAISGTYAVGAGVIGAVIWAKLVEPKKMTPNTKPSKGDLVDFDEYMSNRDTCDIREVGP